jgi:hypothetical protein
LFDRDSERRTRVFDDQADYFSTDTEAWLDPAELAARRKLRAEVEAARQRQRSTLTVTFDFAGRQVVSHADDADRVALDKRFGVVEQSSSVGDAELEKRLAAELDEVERVKLISMVDKSVLSPAAPAAVAAASSSSSAVASVDVPLSTALIAPLQIKPSDNIEMRPIALPREHHAGEANKKSASKKSNNENNKQQSKRGKSNVSTAIAAATGKKKHEKVQSEHDELF